VVYLGYYIIVLPKHNRLTSRYEFNKTRNLAGKLNTKYTADLFHLFYVKPSNYEGASKVGFVISNKFHKNATERNRVKRLFREVVRLNFDKIKDGYWIVIHPKFKAIDANYEQINSDFIKALQNLPFSR
jgi:ribonuclease P protein component